MGNLIPDSLTELSLLANMILLTLLLVFKSSRKSLLEKVMVGEAHHSLKNSVQMIMSMISMQKRNNSSKESALNLLSHSVKSIAAMHEKIYNPGESQGCSSAYLNDLMTCFQDAKKPRVSLKLALDPIKLSDEKLISLGIIVNELVTNSIKHALVSDRLLSVNIKSIVRKKKLELIVSDNGPGIKEDVNPVGYGHEFIRKILVPIDGDMTLASTHRGLEVKVLIPIN